MTVPSTDSAIGPVFTYLLAKIAPLVTAIDRNGVVADGYVLTFPPSGSPLVGVGVDTPFTNLATHGTRNYLELGAMRVNEEFTVPCYVATSIGGTDQATARATSLAVYNAIVRLIATDLTLGGALLNGRWAEIGPVTITQTDDTSDAASTGRWCVIAFSVHCLNYYRPF